MLLPLACSQRDGSVTTVTDGRDDPAAIPEVRLTDLAGYPLLIAPERSELYESALDTLTSAFEKAFGRAPEKIEYAPGDDISGYEKFITFGSTGCASAGEQRAAGLLQGAGYCVCAASDGLAVYATGDIYLADAVSLFTEKYVEKADGDLSLEADFKLIRKAEAATGNAAVRGLALPVMNVSTLLGLPVTSRSTYISATVSLTNTYGEFALDSVPAKIRGRGNGTWQNVEKKPYKLNFDEKIDLLGIGHAADKDWILLSNPLDFTGMRNAITFTLAKKLFTNIGFSVNYSFVELYLNGKYRGVYMLCEQIEANKHKVVINEDPDSVSGSDYFVELDYYAGAENKLKRNVDYFVCEDKNFVIISDHNSTERCMYVNNLYAEMFSALRSGDRERIEKYIDLPSAVDTYLLNEFMKNTDVGWSSFYMAVRSGKIYFTAPWDFDLSSGNDYRVDDFSPTGIYVGEKRTDPNVSRQSSPFFVYLMKCDWFVSLVRERMTELGDGLIETALATVEDTLLLYRTDFENDIATRLREYAPTSSRSNKNFSDATDAPTVLDDNVNRLTDWLEARYVWLKSYFGA